MHFNRCCTIALPEYVTERDFRNVLLQDFNLCTNKNPSIHFSNPVCYVLQYQLLEAPAEWKDKDEIFGINYSTIKLISDYFWFPQHKRHSLVPEWECICKVSNVEVVHFVPLPFEGEDRVGAEPNTPIHPWGEVNSKERETRVRNLYIYCRETKRTNILVFLK